MSGNYQIILCTCPDQASSNKIAGSLIQNKLAACVNILPGITSVYQWQEKIESSQEHLLIIKSHQYLYSQIESEIIKQHPYELPEIIAVPIDQGSPDYLQWIDTCTSPK